MEGGSRAYTDVLEACRQARRQREKPQQSVRGQARSYFGALACIRMLIMRSVAFTAAIT